MKCLGLSSVVTRLLEVRDLNATEEMGELISTSVGGKKEKESRGNFKEDITVRAQLMAASRKEKPRKNKQLACEKFW